MTDDELEELRRRKMLELQAQRENAAVMEEQQAMMEAQRKAALRQILTPEARERLARIKIARPAVAEAVEQQILMLAQSGRLRGKIDDKTLKQILEKVIPAKREISITRR